MYFKLKYSVRHLPLLPLPSSHCPLRKYNAFSFVRTELMVNSVWCKMSAALRPLKPDEMSCKNSVLLFGFCIAIATLAIAIQPLPFEKGEGFETCKNRTDELLRSMMMCIQSQFMGIELNATAKGEQSPKCLECTYVCRKKSEFLQCLYDEMDVLTNLSTKARTRVPFMSQLMETVISGLCEDGTGIIPVSNDDEKRCFRNSWGECSDNLEFLSNADLAFLCDAANPETDPYTIQYICEKTYDYQQCTERSVKNCSLEFMGSMEVLKSHIINFEPCKKYY